MKDEVKVSREQNAAAQDYYKALLEWLIEQVEDCERKDENTGELTDAKRAVNAKVIAMLRELR